ncbi:hypothetical protein TVAG_357530 [Trichomonas vaginalis G3]|uniref:Uncharacterized protein n=1 Tax=Trichomonas vaginalis (strain ATCC PRA-98 / G3) TaxID=412133 RepID=A2F9Q4_TRIV3|nr:guanylate cyclase protein [Trichomonas vaginalis G3]EAX98384.1 hypothetical protein TVAG_357530 [Trichomonas vaginalis G3]KAI5536634.1 guanylate cyclase protein [Trichomonas vaginalis G3]|eukprot:XP_001311314.1 hypothetical protein [Trichomonas vaginalis G3]
MKPIELVLNSNHKVMLEKKIALESCSICFYCITFLDGVRAYKEDNERMDQMRKDTYGKSINFIQYYNLEHTYIIQESPLRNIYQSPQ